MFRGTEGSNPAPSSGESANLRSPREIRVTPPERSGDSHEGVAAASGSTIYEAYKPGTEPGTNRNLGVQGVQEIPISSTGGEERPLTRLAPRDGPASGTGGLYGVTQSDP
jgi:hypothetical protein